MILKLLLTASVLALVFSLFSTIGACGSCSSGILWEKTPDLKVLETYRTEERLVPLALFEAVKTCLIWNFPDRPLQAGYPVISVLSDTFYVNWLDKETLAAGAWSSCSNRVWAAKQYHPSVLRHEFVHWLTQSGSHGIEMQTCGRF